MNAMTEISPAPACPICNKPQSEKYRPFCSSRCADIDLGRWLTGFDSVREGVERSVSIIRNHPLLPADTPVHGLIMDPVTGKLDLVTDGYEYLKTVKARA